MVDQAEIHRMARSKDVGERRKAAGELKNNYAILDDKKQAWEDLQRFTCDPDSSVRWDATHILGIAFSYLWDKKQAWRDLIRLTSDPDSFVRRRASDAIGSAFSKVPDKKQAWEDLHRLISNPESYVRLRASDALSSAFSEVPDKKQAWEDLHRLTSDPDNEVRRGATSALGSTFSHLPDKKLAWEDLHNLTLDPDSSVRWSAADALGITFSDMISTKQAWDDLHRLTFDPDSSVRWSAAYAIGSTFSHLPDKKLAWKDLNRLTSDNNNDVRVLSNHSSGRVCILKACEAEDEEKFRKKMENAMEFFEKASKGATHFNPSKFCLPFYRYYYALIFKKEKEAEAEVRQYIAEAKSAVSGSKSKEKLLEAVESLGNALKEVQNLKEQDFDSVKSDLIAYRQYLDHVADVLDEAEEKAPGAARLVRKGLPIIDERKKAILEDIQEKAKALCKKTQGTPLEPLGIEANQKAKQLLGRDYLSTEIRLNNMIPGFKAFCDFIPLDKRGVACEKLKIIENLDIQEKTQIIDEVLYLILDNMDIPAIRNIPIGRRNKDIIRIATAQLSFSLSTDTFPPELIEKEKIRAKVFNAIRIAKDNGVHILCLPELCICEDWLAGILTEGAGMILIPGSFYDKENHNLCPVICGSDTDAPRQLKFYPSAFEDSKITGTRMVREKKLINIYETESGSFSVLICRDFGNFLPFLRGKVDMIFVPSYNSANERFHKDADNHVTNSPSYIIISNTAIYGGTAIFGQLNKGYFPTLIQKKYKKKDDPSYKLCEIEAEKECMIIADVDLVHKSPQLQTTINPDEETLPVQNIQKIEL